jgi:hypothetical protein
MRSATNITVDVYIAHNQAIEFDRVRDYMLSLQLLLQLTPSKESHNAEERNDVCTGNGEVQGC